MKSVNSGDAIDVAMATYNGIDYLPDMLASLARQRHPGLRLVVCDDGSSDGTVELLERFDDIPVSITRNPTNLGARDNFSKALGLTTAPYVALADQDDVWMPDKIAIMMRRMAELEAGAGAETPVLVFSDLHLVDGDLNLLMPSFFDETFKSRDASRLGDFAISNHVPGCIMLVNRALLDIALPVPPEAHMHDWWLCLVAAALGKIGHVREPLIQFRRHGANESGTGRPKGRADWIAQALRRATQSRDYIQQRMTDTAKMATGANARLVLLDRRYRDRMSRDARQTMDDLMSNRWRRRYAVIRNAHSGESPVSDLLIALQMGRAANRPDPVSTPTGTA
jgi:glycosyltransferase involved in cell wall biosynthesis